MRPDQGIDPGASGTFASMGASRKAVDVSFGLRTPALGLNLGAP
jgi:hypothetical protein